MEPTSEESVHQYNNFLQDYEIVRLHYKYCYWTKRWRLEKEYLPIIEDYVNNGWNLLQIHQSNTKGLFGSPEFLEIIFNRPISEGGSQNRRVKYRS